QTHQTHLIHTPASVSDKNLIASRRVEQLRLTSSVMGLRVLARRKARITTEFGVVSLSRCRQRLDRSLRSGYSYAKVTGSELERSDWAQRRPDTSGFVMRLEDLFWIFPDALLFWVHWNPDYLRPAFPACWWGTFWRLKNDCYKW